MLCLVHLPARAEVYRLQTGDVLEVSVAGWPELLRRVAVQLDGSLPLPLAGRVAAAGATLAEVESRIQTAIASRPLRTYLADGRELLRFVDREQISVSIAEYRPVSITGNVARPGEQPFRPGMTVRHVMAAAGGFTLLRPEVGTHGEAAQLRGEYGTVWVTLAAEMARVWRMKAELGDEVEFDRSSLPPTPVADRVLEQLLTREAEYRSNRAADHEREKSYLSSAAAEAERQIESLTAQQAREEEGVEADTSELQRTTQLLARGMVTQSRVTDARRVLLFSSTRALQTSAQLVSVRRQRGELLREFERADDRRRIRLLAELQEAVPKVATARARLESIEERLRLLGVAVPTSEPGELTITLVRAGVGGAALVRADWETELQPGDIVDLGRGGGAPPLAGILAGARPVPAADSPTPEASASRPDSPRRPASGLAESERARLAVGRPQ
ncbi:polysaccharide biosynthesis/export family protein [Falsiroseomonas sp. HC035]|uniref:polysaccharide biosynthesis/export family protein n=1 Tax=Falsiroseomonas sp. HC035 TaxID=3390999 RepID=UPI003D30F461